MAEARYRVQRCYEGRLTNRHGYSMASRDNTFTVLNAKGDPLRTHDGFAIFDTEQQAAWAVELMSDAFVDGQKNVQAALRYIIGEAE